MEVKIHNDIEVRQILSVHRAGWFLICFLVLMLAYNVHRDLHWWFLLQYGILAWVVRGVIAWAPYARAARLRLLFAKVQQDLWLEENDENPRW